MSLTKLITIKIQEGSRQSCKEKLPRVAATNHDDPHGSLIQIMGHPSSVRVVKKLQRSKNLVVFLHDSPMGPHRYNMVRHPLFTNRVTLQNNMTQISSNLKGSGVYVG